MTAEETARNIAHKIDELARLIGQKVNERYLRTEDWLNEGTRERVVEDAARTILIAWMTGNLKTESGDEASNP